MPIFVVVTTALFGMSIHALLDASSPPLVWLCSIQPRFVGQDNVMDVLSVLTNWIGPPTGLIAGGNGTTNKLPGPLI